MATITISTCQHRGKLSLRCYVEGRPRYRTVKNAKRVEQEKQAWLVELLADKPKTIRRPLAEHITDWHADLLASGNAQHHSDQSKFRVERLCTAAGVTRLDQITADKINRIIAGLRRRPQKKGKAEAEEREFSQQTKNHYLQAIKTFLNWLIRNKRMAGPNPLASLRRKLVDDPSQQRHPRDRFQPDELTLLIATAEKSKIEIEAMTGKDRALLYQLAATTGLRRGELASLCPLSFSFGDRSLVRVLPAYTKDKRLAELDLASDLAPLVQARLVGLATDQPLFPGLAAKDTAKMVAWDCETAGIPIRTTEGKRSFHSLRNSYISMLAESCPLTLTQKLARHKDVRLTARYYRPKTDAERAAIEGLPKLRPSAEAPKLFKPGDVA